MEVGFSYSVDEQNIHLAIVMQTVALYNRLPVLGVSQLRAGDRNAGQMNLATSPDSGDLLDTVKTILSLYVYHGSAESA